MAQDFYPFMKVSLNGEYGVVIKHFLEVTGDKQRDIDSEVYGVIRWDSNNNSDFEDWRGLWGSFLEAGGKEISPDYQFIFINNDGTVKQQ